MQQDKRLLRLRSHLILHGQALCAFAPASWAGGALDVKEMLSRPGVRLVVVEFYATWCKPCMDAIPQWNELHKKYYDQGLRLIVVNTQDPEGLCGAPGWTPDQLVCDQDGSIATKLKAETSIRFSLELAR